MRYNSYKLLTVTLGRELEREFGVGAHEKSNNFIYEQSVNN